MLKSKYWELPKIVLKSYKALRVCEEGGGVGQRICSNFAKNHHIIIVHLFKMNAIDFLTTKGNAVSTWWSSKAGLYEEPG